MKQEGFESFSGHVFVVEAGIRRGWKEAPPSSPVSWRQSTRTFNTLKGGLCRGTENGLKNGLVKPACSELLFA